MKKFGRVILIFILTSFALLNGCNNIDTTDTDDAFVRFVINGIETRTVFPDVKASDLTDIKLTYKKTTAEESTVIKWETVSDLTNITLAVGNYDFTIEAKCKGFNYSGQVENFTVFSGENTVQIDLNLSCVTPDEMEGKGTIDHTYTFPSSEKIKVVKAGLYAYDENDELLQTAEPEEITVTDNGDGTSTAGYSATVDSAEYVLKYFFYADDEATLLMDTYSVTVYVLKDIISKADESTDFLCSVYTISYELNGAEWAEGYEAPVQFTNSTGTLPAGQDMVLSGYHLVKWTEENFPFAEEFPTLSGVSRDVKVYAIWEADTDTQYTVKHWQQNINNDEYTLVTADTQILTGTTDTVTAAVAKTYTGFSSLDFNQANIDGDENTVINIFYNRKIYYITLVLGNGTSETVLDEQSRISGRYGAEVTVETPVLSGSSFRGWINEDNEEETLPAVFTADRTFIASFESNISSGNTASLSVRVNPTHDIAVSVAYNYANDRIVVTAGNDYTNYRWTVNGIPQSCTTETLNIIPNDSEGYNVALTAKKGGFRYSKNVVVDVIKVVSTTEPEVGSIVLENGKFVDKNDFKLVKNHIKPVGVVCKINTDGTTGFILGLTNSYKDSNYLQWAIRDTTGFNTNFEAIQGTISDGDIDGSDNWQAICEEDPEGTLDPSTNYPAFDYVLNYGVNANLTGTEYADGWYMPSQYELYNYIYLNKDVLNKSIVAAEGTIVSPNLYWSSSGVEYHNNDLDNYVRLVHMNNGKDTVYGKQNGYFVCCIRAF